MNSGAERFIRIAIRQSQHDPKRLEELAKTLDPAKADQIHSELRSRKVDLTFALGGVINHELYFSGIGGKGGPATGKVAELIDKSFGNFEAYRKDLKATVITARGWT